MISEDINTDKLLSDIEQQIEVLSAIAQDNAILNEQLRLLHEAKEVILNQQMEMERLAELIDPDEMSDHSTLLDRFRSSEAED